MRTEPVRRILSNFESDDPGTRAALNASAAPLAEGRYERIEEANDLAREAEEHGLVVLISGCPRGGDPSKDGETAIRVVSCPAQMAALFCGGASKGTDALLDEVRAIRDGGAHGSIIGRNVLSRSRDDALGLLHRIARIHAEEAPAAVSGELR